MNTLFAFGFKKKKGAESGSAKKSKTPVSVKKNSKEEDLSRSKNKFDKRENLPQPVDVVSVQGPITKKARLERPVSPTKPVVPASKITQTNKPNNSSTRPRRQRKTIRANIIESDDSDAPKDEEDDEFVLKDVKSNAVTSEDEEEEEALPLLRATTKKTPKQAAVLRKKLSYSTPPVSRPNFTGSAAKSASKSSSKSLPPTPSRGVRDAGEHTHNFLSFLQPENLMDKKRRRPDHPDYDSTSVFVPNSFLAKGNNGKKITPAMQMWWKAKSENFDAVLFFKVGKFYELYHMDADVGVKHLNMLYMKGENAHAGFPEISYGKFSAILADLGFRVARVEQVETPEQQKIRTGKSSGPVMRKLCSVLSPGTRTFSFRSDNC